MGSNVRFMRFHSSRRTGATSDVFSVFAEVASNTVTRRAESGYGKGLKTTASTIEKTAVSAAIPAARMSTARMLKPGLRSNERKACFHLVVIRLKNRKTEKR